MVASDSEERTPRRFRWFARGWAVAAGFHLTLTDVRHLDWLVPNVLLGLAAVALLLRPVAPGRPLGWLVWLAGLVGLTWPLLLLGDQLTQSVHLAGMAVATLLCARPGEDRLHARAIRWGTLVVYGVAAFHKLNADFLDGSVSCATGGVRLLGDNWGIALAPSPLDPFWPALFLAAELSLVILFRLAPRWAVPLALTLHVPLTIVFAPAFAWVMVAGYPCFFRDEDLAALTRRLRAKRGWVLGMGLGLGTVNLLLYFRDHWVVYPAWQLGEMGVWVMAVAAWVGLGPTSPVRPTAWREPGRSKNRWRAWLVVALFLLDATTPYLGLQFHHTAAMLSNLRTDRGCWNHLLVPEAVRRRDPYVRIDRAHPGPRAAGRDALRSLLEQRLWAPASLRDIIDEACRHDASPLRLEGSYAGAPWRSTDACADENLPRGAAGLFQTNLERTCPQRCIH